MLHESTDSSSLLSDHTPMPCPPKVYKSPPTPHLSPRAVTGGLACAGPLPGVQSVHHSAVLAEKARREGEAALKIQTAFRGYRARKSLQWVLPHGQSLARARTGDGEEEGAVGANGVPQKVPAQPPATALTAPSTPALSGMGAATLSPPKPPTGAAPQVTKVRLHVVRERGREREGGREGGRESECVYK